MDLCAHVQQTFVDPSTEISHPCSWFCDYQTPALSYMDCQYRCPELWECLTRSKSNAQAANFPSTYVLPLVRSERLSHEITTVPDTILQTNTIIIIAVSVVAVIISLLIAGLVYKLKINKKGKAPQRVNDETIEPSQCFQETISQTAKHYMRVASSDSGYEESTESSRLSPVTINMMDENHNNEIPLSLPVMEQDTSAN